MSVEETECRDGGRERDCLNFMDFMAYARARFVRVRQSFLFPLGRKTLELTIDACVKPGLWSVAIELMERMQDESVTPETWLILSVG